MAWLFRTALGYGVACLASGTVVATVVNYPLSPFPLLFVVTAMIALFASLPALIAILAAERWLIRHPAYYCAAATAIGVALGVLLGFPSTEKNLPVTGLCFGPVAGWLYWRIAGRHAGG